MKVLVLLNKNAGTLAGLDPDDASRRIQEGFAFAGAEAEVELVEGKQLEPRARRALYGDADAIIAGGGDGTINTIANVVSEGSKAFGVLPLGTFNHFAKELGVPLDLDEAVAALARGRVDELPVAEVNGRIFLNFSAIGVHPEVVEERDALRRRAGTRGKHGKMLALPLAFAKVLKRMPVHDVRLSTRGHTFVRSTPSIIVCNNVYQMRAFGVEAASVPDRGLLNVYVATRARPKSLVWLMLRATVGRLGSARHFDAMALPELRVETRWRRHHLKVSIDGEVQTLRPPLQYRIRGKPLRVLVPAKPEPNDGSANGDRSAPANAPASNAPENAPAPSPAS